MNGVWGRSLSEFTDTIHILYIIEYDLRGD